MRASRGIAALIATALFLLAPGASLLRDAEAQVTDGSVWGSVCESRNPTGELSPDNGGQCSAGMLPNATVRFVASGIAGTDVGAVNKSIQTDAKGHYEMDGLPAGEYQATATRLGFQDATATVTVQSGATTTQDFPLAGKAVEGTVQVVTSGGKGIPGAYVSVCCDGQDGVSGSTDDTGSWSFTSLAGYRTVKAAANGYDTASQLLLIDGSHPLTLVLQGQGTTAPDATVRGHVHDQDGKPVAGATIHAYSSGPYPGPYYGCNGDVCYASGCASTTSPDGQASDPAPPCAMPVYYSGETTATTDSDGDFELQVYGGSSVSLSINQDGYAPWSDYPYVENGQTLTLDVLLVKYPERTAHLVGHVTDAKTGKGLNLVALNMNWPEYGIYECSDNGQGYDGYAGGGVTYTASATPMPARASDDTNTVTGNPANGGTAEPGIRPAPYPYDNGCRIRIGADGSFDLFVTPGYAQANVYFEQYKSCTTTTNADHSSMTVCGPDYFPWLGTLTLAAGGTTRLDIALTPRPAMDATVSGYLVDGKSKQALRGGYVSFYNLDNGAGGQAETDADGSYKVGLRSGLHHVTVYIDGYLPWQGMLNAHPGDNALDILLTRGNTTYGGCYRYCVLESYNKDGVMVGAPAPSSPSGGTTGSSTSATDGAGGGPAAGAPGSGDGAFEDLHGGLGPYDPAKRQAELEQGGKSSPPLAVAFAVLALAGAAVAMRRRLRA